jgi:hypothetical protein
MTPGSASGAGGSGALGGSAAPGAPGAGGSYAPNGPSAENPTGEMIEPFQPIGVPVYVRKVKNLMTGLAPTDDEVSAVSTAKDPRAALQGLIDGWSATPEFEHKLLVLFGNMFQQTGFTPTEDFKPQLLENGGFDLGPLGVYGDTAFPQLVRNLEESFARTALEIVRAGEPFTNVLTTQRFMMTTALKSLYLQIEMPNDQPFNFRGSMNTTPKLMWSVDMSGTVIPLEDTLDPSSPNHMVFDDEPPVNAVGFELTPTCRGDMRVNMFTGYAQLFQRLIGVTPRYPYAAMPECWEHASKPVFTDSDVSDWQMVSIHSLASGESRIEPYDLPALRSATELGLALPRVGFFTTPAFLALWNTNDSNQHRVTANQTLLVATGQGFTSSSSIVPASTVGLDADHAVEGSECYGCHKSLDPLRQFWANQFDYNDRNDFPARRFGGMPNPRPTTTGGALAFGDVNGSGTTMTDLGAMLAQMKDGDLSRFGLAMAQQLCFFADSASCQESDPEMQRVVRAFQDAHYDFKVLVRELLSSPLVTGAANTETFAARNVTVSIARREHLCAALSARLHKPDLCALEVAFPFSRGGRGGAMGTTDPYAVQRATFRLAGSVATEGFSRGSELPVTPSEPTLFYRAASELLCENIAAQAVDATDSPYSSSAVDTSLAGMVEQIMGYTPSDTHHAMALQILHEHFDEARGTGASATDAMRSTFALACQSPTSLAFGL